MSENETNNTANNAGDNTEQVENENKEETKGFTPIESQEDLDKIIQARLERERKRYSDYDEVKAKAEQFDQRVEEDKSEIQKATERAEKAEQRANELELRSLKAEVANAKGVPARLLSGDTQEALEESADALLEFRGEKKNSSPRSEALSRTNTSEPKNNAQAFADLFN